jgi:hypothetical protein
MKPALKVFTSILAGAALLTLALAPMRQGELDAELFRAIETSEDGPALAAIERGANVHARYLSPRFHPTLYDRLLVLIGRTPGICGNTEGDALQEQDTPLVAASRAGRLRIVQALLDRGAAVNPTMNGDLSPLMWTVMGTRFDNESEHALTALLLIERGADINARTSWGYTALTYANGCNQKALIRIIRDAGGRE